MGRVTRGFSGRAARRDPRLPPGQYDIGDFWPVLTAEVTPQIDEADWQLRVDGLVERPTTWSWQQLMALPRSIYRGDIHCVTTWSKLGVEFAGVSLDALFEITGILPSATHVLAYSHTGYNTNLPLADVTGDKAWIAYEYEGQPLPTEHGGPARLLVPHLYFWKSAKWVSGIQLMDHNEMGFWERNGYHNHGDPWLEQRYTGD